MRSASFIWIIIAMAIAMPSSAQQLQITFDASAQNTLLEADQEQISDTLSEVFEELKQVLPGLPEIVTITVELGKDVLPGLGVGGFTNSSELSFYLVLDPDHESEPVELVRAHAKRFVFHESHHLARINLFDSEQEPILPPAVSWTVTGTVSQS